MTRLIVITAIAALLIFGGISLMKAVDTIETKNRQIAEVYMIGATQETLYNANSPKNPRR